jgi:hypothetical protein
MGRCLVAIVAAVATAATIALGVSIAGAANSPTMRDCSFAGGLDPDFVALKGVKVGNGGSLTVSSSRGHVKLIASESSDPGDMTHGVSFKAKVTSHNLKPKKASGMGTGKVALSLPLAKRRTGRRYTISWNATFDNGFHTCPGSQIPANPKPDPFVVRVS